jgi:hypothetical protein
MSANFGSGGSQEVDLNITPIIDCFTVLITFLLASASFISIGFFEAATPGNASDASAAEPETEVVVKIHPNQSAEFKIKGKRNGTLQFNLTNAESLKSMQKEIESLKAPELKLNQILISADDSVDYKSMTQVMDQINKANLPLVVGEF